MSTTVPDGSAATPDEVPTEQSKTPVYGGRYAVEAEVGHGGMGRVFRARDLKIGRPVALKILAAGAQRERFEQEARAAGALNHPNILAVFDVGEDGGGPWIVSELLEGETLRAALRDGPLALEEVLDLATQLAGGLAAAHRKGIVHRDLKPENLFLTDEGRLKILDFGIARILPEAKGAGPARFSTETGAVLGTPAYMSPEQVRGEEADARSDIFACGAVLHEMLSGRGLFARATSVDAAYAILHDAPPAVPPGPLCAIIARCLEKDPATRYADGAELLRDLTSIAGKGSLPHRFGERRRFLLAAAAVTAVALALAFFLSRTRASAPPPSIAVLPFVDLSPQKDQEYFSDGLAEELLNALAHVEGLRVTGRTSAFSFKGKNEDLRSIGEKLGVAHVIEGSVRKADNRVRVTAQLIDVASGFHLWSQSYDRELKDIFAVQDEIARAVVAALRIELLPGREPSSKSHRTSNPEVYAQYLLGRQLYNRSAADFPRSVEAFQKALAIDPGYAPAWAGLAYALVARANFAGSAAAVADDRSRAAEAAEKAVAVDSDLADGYAARGFVRATVTWDWAGARADLERALALNPGDPTTHRNLGLLAKRLGRMEQAITSARKATELDPLDARAWAGLGVDYLVEGRLDLSRRAMERARQIAPDFGGAASFEAFQLQFEGKPRQALAAHQAIRETKLRLFGVAMAQCDLGNPVESEQALQALISGFQHNSAYLIAAACAWCGDYDRAFRWLERAYEQREPGLGDIKTLLTMRKLHGDPRYLALLRKMNLPLD